MNCNCISDMERRVADKYTQDTGISMTATCQNIGILLDPPAAGDAIYMTTFKVTGQVKGFGKGKTISVTASFCPFCGKAVKP